MSMHTVAVAKEEDEQEAVAAAATAVNSDVVCNVGPLQEGQCHTWDATIPVHAIPDELKLDALCNSSQSVRRIVHISCTRL